MDILRPCEIHRRALAESLDIRADRPCNIFLQNTFRGSSKPPDFRLWNICGAFGCASRPRQWRRPRGFSCGIALPIRDAAAPLAPETGIWRVRLDFRRQLRVMQSNPTAGRSSCATTHIQMKIAWQAIRAIMQKIIPEIEPTVPASRRSKWSFFHRSSCLCIERLLPRQKSVAQRFTTNCLPK